MLKKILLTVTITFALGLLVSNGVAAQTSPPSEIIFHMQRGSVVNLENFPTQTTLTFSVKSAGGYVASIKTSDLQIFEDGYAVSLNEEDGIEITHHPVSFTIIFDYAPEQGAETHIPDIRELQDMVGAITGQRNATAPFPSNEDDTWLFCSTTGPRECLEGKGNPQALSFGRIHHGLFGSGAQNVPLSVLLRQALARGQNATKQLVIVKVRPQAEIPYFSDSLITELLLSEIPVALINLTEANDTEMFQADLRARLRQIGGHYYESGGSQYWEHLIRNDLPNYRPTSFRISYRSRLFRDERTHTVLLGYEDQGLQAWEEAEFRFLSEDQANNPAKFSTLSPLVTTLNIPLTLVLFLFLMIFLIWSVEEQYENPGSQSTAGSPANLTALIEEQDGEIHEPQNRNSGDSNLEE